MFSEEPLSRQPAGGKMPLTSTPPSTKNVRLSAYRLGLTTYPDLQPEINTTTTWVRSLLLRLRGIVASSRKARFDVVLETNSIFKNGQRKIQQASRRKA
jgi:hypothetical protein